MAVLGSPAARAVRTACFAEQMQQKKQLLLASSQKSYPPAFHSLINAQKNAIKHLRERNQKKRYVRQRQRKKNKTI
jgi:hypothetical protein